VNGVAKVSERITTKEVEMIDLVIELLRMGYTFSEALELLGLKGE